MGAELNLDETLLEPSRATLRDYGNVSSASTWYALGWLEACRGVKRGQKILQARGSGVTK